MSLQFYIVTCITINTVYATNDDLTLWPLSAHLHIKHVEESTLKKLNEKM